MSKGIGSFKSPNDSPGDGTIHPIALKQLQAYQKVADSWQYYETDREVRCEYCLQNLWFIYDKNGVVYEYSREELLVLTVAHIRQRHSEVAWS